MKTTIKFPKSDSFAFFVTINKIAKALDNAFFTVKENPDEEPVLQKKLGAGISLSDSRLYKNQLSYKVQIDGADTANMEVGVRYFFDVKGTIGNAQKTFLWGELILSETETGYLNPAMQGDTVAVAQVYTATFETGVQSQYVEYEVDPVATAKIGDMTKLNTTAKDTLVKAINEVNAPTFTEAEALVNIVSGEKQSTLWGKIKKWFASLKALAFKDKVGTGDITDGAVTTAKFSSDAKCPNATNADNATNAKKVNDLEITRDANGVLKIGDIVIPQKKLIWSGSKVLDDLKELSIDTYIDLRGKILEFIVDTPNGLLKAYGKMNSVGYENKTMICSFLDGGNISRENVVWCGVFAKSTKNSVIMTCKEISIIGESMFSGTVSVHKIYEIIE